MYLWKKINREEVAVDYFIVPIYYQNDFYDMTSMLTFMCYYVT